MDLAVDFADRPALGLTSYEPIHVHVPPVEVTEAMVDEQLAREMARFAVVSEVEGPVAEGDNLIADLQVSVNGEPSAELSGEKVGILLVRGMLPDGFINGIAGMEVGQSRAFDFAAADASDASSVPDEFRVQITLVAARRRIVPELTDGFVQARLSATDKTVGEFRERVRAHLQQGLADQRARRREEAADAALAQRLDGTVPDELIQQTSATIVQTLRANLAGQGMSLEQHMASQGLDERRFQMMVMMQARESVRQGLALDALYRHLGYGLEEADVDRALAELAPGNEERARQSLETDEAARRYVLETAARLKAHDWLMRTTIFE